MNLLIMVLVITPTWAQVKVEEHYEEGIEAWEAQRYDIALQAFDRVARDKPDLYRVYYYRALVKLALGDAHAALIDMLIFMEVNPDDREALWQLSLIQLKLGRYYEAKSGLLLLLQKKSSTPTSTVFFRKSANGDGVDGVMTAQSTHAAYLFRHLGLAYHGLTDYDSALIYYDSAYVLNPDNPDLLLSRGITNMEAGYLSAGYDDLLRVLHYQPDNSQAHYNLAVLREKLGKYTEAEDSYSRAIEGQPASPQPYRQRGYQRLLAGNLVQALEDFTCALMLEPEEASTWLNQGIAYQRLGQPAEALFSYSKAVELDPAMAQGYLNRGNVYYKLGEYEQALREYDLALFYNKSYALAYYHRGIAKNKVGEAHEACKDLAIAQSYDIDVAKVAARKICENP